MKWLANYTAARKAEQHRKVLGNSALTVTANKALKLLKGGGFRAMILGGYALQHHGYSRFTEDVDIVVDNVQDAVDYLSIRGFREVAGTGIMYDRENKVMLNILEAGKHLTPKSILPVPTPTEPIISLERLLSDKLSAHNSAPVRRLKDLADVSEMIQRHKLPRDFPVDSRVQHLYTDLWDKLTAESKSI